MQVTLMYIIGNGKTIHRLPKDVILCTVFLQSQMMSFLAVIQYNSGFFKMAFTW